MEPTNNSGYNAKQLREAKRLWDDAAASFDDEPDHGLRDPAALEAWTKLLKTWTPSAPAKILDVGCGTGSLSVVLAGLGHQVTGIDLSPAMLSLAQAKAGTQGCSIVFHVMNAAAPQFPAQQFDVIVCRHLLWTLPEPAKVLRRWADLLNQNGRVILIEGYWKTGAGLPAQQIVEMLPSVLINVSLQNLSDQPELWGDEVCDERYVLVADLCR